MNQKERITDSLNNHEWRELQAVLDTANDENKRLVGGIDVVNNEGVRLRRENTRLKEFARYVIRQECWGFDLDGCEIQEVAENLKLIEPRIATEDDVDDESDYEVGDTIFVFSDVLKEKP